MVSLCAALNNTTWDSVLHSLTTVAVTIIHTLIIPYWMLFMMWCVFDILKVLLHFCGFLLSSRTLFDLCALPASVLTHQVHPGCSVAQRHADPGGRVSDDLMTHVTLTFLFSFAPTRGCCPTIHSSVSLSGAFFSFPMFLVYLPKPDDELDFLGLWGQKIAVSQWPQLSVQGLIRQEGLSLFFSNIKRAKLTERSSALRYRWSGCCNQKARKSILIFIFF